MLLIIAVETVVVYNLVNRHSIACYHERMRAARDAHAAWAQGAAKSARGADKLKTSLMLAVSRLPAPGEGSLMRPWSRRRRAEKSAPTRDAVVDGLEPRVVGTLDDDSALPPTTTQDDMQRGYNAWLAYVVDKATFWTVLLLYVLAACLIFIISAVTAPDVCALAGVERSIQCQNRGRVNH